MAAGYCLISRKRSKAERIGNQGLCQLKRLQRTALSPAAAKSPGKDKESNWLPAPKEPFYMLMRMYLPKIEVLNGQYEIPGVVNGK